MNMVSKLTAGAAVALISSLAPALADGMEKAKGHHYAAPVHKPHCAQFGGFYLGAVAGSATHNTGWTDRDSWSTPVAGGGSLGYVERTDDGITLGATIGYNVQKGCTVWGFEADLSWANVDHSRVYTGPAAGGGGIDPVTLQSSIDWLGTLRTRSGVVVDSLLLYVTGGLAFVNVDHRWSIVNGVNESFSSSDTRWGWTAGAGAEWQLSDRMSLKSEVLYISLEEEHKAFVSARAVGGTGHFDLQDSLWVGRIGLNFKLGHGGHSYAPLK